MKAMFEAAARWRGPVALFSEGILVRVEHPPCACRGLGLVPRPVQVRGTTRYTFDPCQNPDCGESAHPGKNVIHVKKQGHLSNRRGAARDLFGNEKSSGYAPSVSPCLTPSDRG